MQTARDEAKILLGFIGFSIVSWNVCRKLKEVVKKHLNATNSLSEWIPVGRIKSLQIYPIKSCKGKEVFQYRCTAKGPVFGDYSDRHFMIVDGDTGRFYTARTKPTMVLIEAVIENAKIYLSHPQFGKVEVDIEMVKLKKDVRKGFLHCRLRQDGYDCGDAVSKFLSAVLGETDVRMIMYVPGLYSERTCKTEKSWWNNPVPERIDDTGYADLAPYMITTQGSLDDLNKRLDKDVSSTHFRPCIVIDDCLPWDEDKWLNLRIGDTQLQCFKPCTRCILTTVDPETGVKDSNMQPLKKLREFRLAPEGKMLDEFKDSPIFGVNAGIVKEGYIHVGQTVWAQYKPSAF